MANETDQRNMTNEELIRRFENNVIRDDSFHHADHVRLAFAYLSQYPIDPIDNARGRYTVRYYIIAILFVVFDVETIFLFNPRTDGALRRYRMGRIFPSESGLAHLEGRNPEPLLP